MLQRLSDSYSQPQNAHRYNLAALLTATIAFVIISCLTTGGVTGGPNPMPGWRPRPYNRFVSYGQEPFVTEG